VIEEASCIHLAVIVIALGACMTDLRWRRIPNSLVVSGFCLGAGLHLYFQGIAGLGASLAGALLGLSLFLPFYALGGMGAGDVKLLAALGSLLGPGDLLRAALVGALAGGLLAVFLALAKGKLRDTLRGVGSLLTFWTASGLRPSREMSLQNPSALKIPYAVPLAAGVLVVVLSHGRPW
jgi:prepilin peptidase CpaA